MLRRTFLKAVGALAAALGMPAAAKPLDMPSGMAMSMKDAPARGPKVRMGDTIVCPGCGEKVAKALRDIFSGEMARSSAFESYQGPLAGRQLRCVECNAPYARSGGSGVVGNVHTDRGWL